MATLELLLARSFAGGYWHTAFDRWLKLRNAAGAPQRLGRYILAWWAEADVAEFCALMLLTWQLLVADNHAEVTALRVRVLASHWTAHVLAFMLLTLLIRIANTRALQVIDLVDLLLRHHLRSQRVRIIYRGAWEFSLGLVANAAFVDHLLALHALIVVALFDALVAPTRQESFTERVADGHRFDAALALAPKQAFYGLVAGGAVDLAFRIPLAGKALALMTDLLTLVVSAVECAAAFLLAGGLGLTAQFGIDTFAAEAELLNGNRARAARARMADLLTLVDATIEHLFASILTRVSSASSKLAWHELLLFLTVASH